MNSRALSALAAIGLAACASSSALGIITLVNAQQVRLDVVLAQSDRQVQIMDKIFTFQTFTSIAFNPASIFVTGYVAANPLAGIGFDLTGPYNDPPGDLTISEFNLRYTVEIEPSAYAAGFRIVDTGLTFDGHATGAGSYSRVDESVLDYFGQPGLNLLGTRRAFYIAGNPPIEQSQDFQLLPNPPVGIGYSKLEINKDVQFYAQSPTSTATASFVRQSFSQVPSPGGMALLGLAGLVAARRRRA